MERTMKVKGKGRIAIKPDRIQLMLHTTDVKQTYEQVMEEATQITKVLKDIFERLGFKKEDLKTTQWNVNAKYEGYQDEKHVWRQKFVGYEYNYGLKIEFGSDNALLGKILYELAQCEANPQIQLHYTVKDKEAAKKELLERAVKESMEKADILAKASGVTLGDIVNIDYSWEEIELSAHPVSFNKAQSVRGIVSEASYDIDMEAEDIVAEDTVTVVWGIV